MVDFNDPDCKQCILVPGGISGYFLEIFASSTLLDLIRVLLIDFIASASAIFIIFLFHKIVSYYFPGGIILFHGWLFELDAGVLFDFGHLITILFFIGIGARDVWRVFVND